MDFIILFKNSLLLKVLQLKEGELATMEKLDNLGFDSVIITKSGERDFKIDIMRTNSFEEFIFNSQIFYKLL